ncbi:MAG: hypothetical protein DRQ43_03800 [Gammaproteobacteria bacterium]|nr:MAG: hypothetical protein DRQ43_03800 [Gammaproteobacteria bacterium]
MTSITDYFQTNLRAEKALSQEQKDDAHRLRFSVYCNERGYEDSNNFPDQLESDEYDIGAVQTLIRHRESNHPLGVARLVLPEQINSERPFPIEKHFGHVFDKSILQQFDFSDHNIAEISRFAISQQSIEYIFSNSSQPSIESLMTFRRTAKELVPHISLGLIAMLFTMSQQHQIKYLYAAMEPSLNRRLARLGIKFTQIGPAINYHGKRQPMIGKVDDLLRNIYYEKNDFFQLIKSMGGARYFDEQLPLNIYPGVGELATAW